MVKVVKFGGSSLASAEQFKKVGNIIRAEESRRFVVPSAPGKRFPEDTKVTDMLYKCYAEAEAGKNFDKQLKAIEERYNEIIKGLSLKLSLKEQFETIKKNFEAKAGTDYAASRGEYLNGIIMANYLGYEFIDAATVICFDANGEFDGEKTNQVMQDRLANVKAAVIPGFYGAMPNGAVKTFSRGGSDVTGSIVARAIKADVIRINSQSGKGGVAYILKQSFGINVPQQMREQVGYMVKQVSDEEHKELSPEWVHSIFTDNYVDFHPYFTIPECHFKQVNGIFAEAVILHNDSTRKVDANGNGRLDAVSNIIKQYFDISFELTVYEEHALSHGSSSKAMAYVGITVDGSMFWGTGVDEDIIKASIGALVVAVNHYLATKADSHVKDERYIAMLNFIQANYKTVSLADMAAQFNLTEPYISKYIKEKSGKTFGELVTNANVGENVKAAKVLKDYDAVVLCCGAANPRDINAPGRDAQGIYFAVDYLTSVTKSLLDSDLADKKYIDAKGRKVVVIGGGDTGNDCVGTSIRLGCASVVQLEMMPKLPDTRAENNPWPQWPRVCKTDYGQEEAIAVFGKDPRLYQTTVKEFIKDKNGKLCKVKCVKLESKKDEKTGRMMMAEVAGSEFELEADLVLIAAGFLGTQKYVADAFGVTLNARTNVDTAPGKHATNVDKVFTAGDMHRGQSLVVWAIREGRDAAKEVDEYLMGYTNLQ